MGEYNLNQRLRVGVFDQAGTSEARAVYPGMRRATVIMIGALLMAPALAQAKAGLEFDTYPDTAQPGEKINFTVMAFREPPPGGPPRAQPEPIAGRHPLVTFRSQSGRVVRVRVAATNTDGIAHGSVAFPDKGPWTTALKVGDELQLGAERSEPIRVGVGLVQTTPASRAPTPATGDFPWVWVLSLGAIGSALLVLVMRRRGHWGAA
jgi:hypothetical protein